MGEYYKMVVTDQGYYMDNILQSKEHTIAHNLRRDWYIMIIVAGSGMVRVGKSFLAQQFGYYLASILGTKFDINNVVFTSADLKKQAEKLEKYSVIIYDEAKTGLDSKKTMTRDFVNTEDFFTVCGKLNHIFILVTPCVFKINRYFAVERSHYLLNTFVKINKIEKGGRSLEEWERGYWQWFERTKKNSFLGEFYGKHNPYRYARKYRNFYGKFPNHNVIDNKLYDNKKQLFLDQLAKSVDNPTNKFKDQRDALIKIMQDKGVNQTEISKLLKEEKQILTQRAVSHILNGYTKNTPLFRH